MSELPCPPPGDLPDPGIKPRCLHCRQILYHRATGEALASAKHQHKSVICIPMDPPSGTSLPPPSPAHPLACHRALDLSHLRHTANFQRLSNSTHGNVYVSMLLSQFIPPSPSSTCSKAFFMSVKGPCLDHTTCPSGVSGRALLLMPFRNPAPSPSHTSEVSARGNMRS